MAGVLSDIQWCLSFRAYSLTNLSKTAPIQNVGFAAESCVNPAHTLPGKEGGGFTTDSEHNTCVLEKEVWTSVVAESLPRSNKMLCSSKMWFYLSLSSCLLPPPPC